MNITRCDIPGLLIVEPKIFGDGRGYFLETYQRERYRAMGLEPEFVQDNLSFSRQGILRGLHLQRPNPQGKLVAVLQGEVYDVAVDLRRESPTLGHWHALTLSAETKRQFYIPPGFAHGFQVLSETALFFYKCTALYAPQHELTIRWDDPDLAIPWPLPQPIVSAKDAAGMRLRDVPADRLVADA